LAAGGGVYAFRLVNRPQPVMSVTSNYKVGTTQAGSTSTTLQVSGHKFSGNSAITFLLDGTPVPGNQPAHSDADGNVTTTLTITSAWSVGNHTLTAKDADDDTTKVGSPITIVPQGQAHTPGPNGAPPDDASGTINITLRINGATQTETGALIITGKPDPAGGTVCQATDDGQPHLTTGTSAGGISYHESASWTCSGTYKGGKLAYTRTATSDKIDFVNGLSCVARVPYISAHIEGTFSNATTISGTYYDDSITADCNNGAGVQHTSSHTGTWTGQIYLR
ncbi:MAG: hypothetical protein JOZ18_03915, partial [Chloroflexi bacterium]|nr:hypothetical protein [Chloroflexota bacterium]